MDIMLAVWTRLARSSVVVALTACLIATGNAWGGSIFDDDWSPPPLVTPAPSQAPMPSPPVQTEPSAKGPTPPADVKPQPDIGNPSALQSGATPKPIPTSQQMAKVRVLFKDVYSRQLADASSKGKKALAIQLLDDASKVTDAPVDQFVMLAGARRAAIEAGDVDSAITADDDLCKSFAIDAQESRLELLTRLSKVVHLAPGCAAIAIAAAGQSDVSAQRGAYNLAHEFAEVAVVAAKGAENVALLNDATNREAGTRAVAAAYVQLDKSLAVLRKTPTDPEANLAVGRFYCLMVGQWAQGLKFLAAGSDARFGAAAKADLQGADALSIADQWRLLADKESPLEKRNIKLRAAKWYEDALATATGLAKLKAERELAGLNLGPSGPSRQPTLSADPDAPPRPQLPRAIAAIAKYDAIADTARAEFDRAMTLAHKQAVTELDLAEKQAVRAQNLDEVARIDSWKKRVETKSGPPVAIADLKAQIIDQHLFSYKYGTFGAHNMEFLPEGRIGTGWGALEKKWDVAERPGGLVIVLSGDQGSAEFGRKEDGSYVGKWPDGNPAVLRLPEPGKTDSANGNASDRPRSPAALAALKNFEAASDKARANHLKAMAGPLKQLLSELTFAEKEAMKSQDLAEAKRIDDWKKSVQSKSAADSAAGDSRAVYLSDLKETHVEGIVREREWTLAKNVLNGNNVPLAIGGTTYKHGLGFNPGDGQTVRIAYTLDRGYKRFTGAVGVNDTGGGFEAVLTFKILGNGRELWKSRPCHEAGKSQAYDVNVAGVDRLELVVECPGTANGANVAWVDPRVE